MIESDDLKAENWGKYGELILSSELIYPQQIRTPMEEFIEILSSEDTVAKVLLVDSRYAGNAIGFCLTGEEKRDFGLDGVTAGSNVIYLFNFVVNPEFQGNGYGRRLLKEFIMAARNKGYDTLAGHFRNNGSLHIIEKLGAQKKGILKDWESTGEDYIFCLLDLRTSAVMDFIENKSPEHYVLQPASAIAQFGVCQRPLTAGLRPVDTNPLANLQVPALHCQNDGISALHP